MSKDIYNHIKTGGLYEVLCLNAHIEGHGIGGDPQVVYCCRESGQVWVRPHSEFFDGRFEYVGKSTEKPFDPLQDIVDFHKKYELDYQGPIRALDEETHILRLKLMSEELEEWADGQNSAFDETSTSPDHRCESFYVTSLEEVLDSLIDLQYVLLGTVHLHGFTHEVWEEAWRRVHEANMAKVRADLDGSNSKRDSHMDVVKPAGWVAPNHRDLIENNTNFDQLPLEE